ncbi:MAG: CocE/NonD family hydrolase [Chthonomonadales bacterium]
MKRFGGLISLIAVMILAVALKGNAQLAPISERYVKYELYIPMRDGVRLFSNVYIPIDRTKTYPIMLNRSPYSASPYGPTAIRGSLGPSNHFSDDGYIFVYQDVRGKYLSEGNFLDVRPQLPEAFRNKGIDESTDTYDTIDFLVKTLPANNGRVGIWGISYPGFYAAVGSIHSHPALKAASPQAPVTNWFMGDDFHHNGALFLMDSVSFISSFGPARPVPTTNPKGQIPLPPTEGAQFYKEVTPLSKVNTDYFKGKIAFWNDMVAHTTYDSYWQARNTTDKFYGVKTAVLTVGGWYDAEDLHGALHTYSGIEKMNPGATNMIVMGPWSHGGWSRGPGDRFGDIALGAKTGEEYREKVEYAFFAHYLKDKPGYKPAEATMFATGANKWMEFSSWPPKARMAKSLFIQPNKALSFNMPGSDGGTSKYVSDPANPVPYYTKIDKRYSQPYMNADQRFVEGRPDVLAFKSEPLKEDTTLAGPIIADLFVSITGTDADFIVKLIDVYPDDSKETFAGDDTKSLAGYEAMVRAEVMRGKFRKSFQKPEAFKPGQVSEVKFEVPDVLHTFKKGHRIMIQVQSTWFPLVDLNPQTFGDIFKAKSSDFIKATHTIYHSTLYPSHIEVGVLPGK